MLNKFCLCPDHLVFHTTLGEKRGEGKQNKQKATDICLKKKLCVYENETHFFLSALVYKYKYLFSPLFIRC